MTPPNGDGLGRPLVSPRDDRSIEEGSTPLATYWQRMGGLFFDLVVVGVLATLIAVAAGVHTGVVATRHGAHLGARVSERLGIELAVFVVYAAISWASPRAQTLGMWICRIQVVDAGTGRAPGRAKGIVRAFAFTLVIGFSELVIVPVVVDLVWPLWDRRNQTLHDKVAQTVVIRRSVR